MLSGSEALGRALSDARPVPIVARQCPSWPDLLSSVLTVRKAEAEPRRNSELGTGRAMARDDRGVEAASNAEGAPADIRIGGRLRHARLLKGMSLKEVAAGIGVSESFVSKLENDRVQPSLAVLHRLVSFLGLNVAAMFSAGNEGTGPLLVMRAGDRPTITTRLRQKSDGVVLERLVPQTRNALLQVNIHHVVPGGGSHGLISHLGEEMGYVLEGILDLTVGDQVCCLSQGNSFYFPSEEPHGYRNPGREVARILWVNTPPTF